MPTSPLIHTRFRAQAARSPSAVAVSGDRGSLTFQELDARAEALAEALGRCGAGTIVGVHIDRSIDWVVALLGTLRAGAAVLPLPPSFPRQRLRELIEVARPALIVDAPASRWADYDPVPTIDLTGVRSASPGLETTADDPDQPAFVLFSSGSTGRPKLIVRSHRSFFHRLQWTWATHPFAPGEVCCQKAHMTTTHAVYELFEPLLQGVPVHVIPDEQVRNLEQFWQVVRDRRVSRLLLVPSALRASLDMPGFEPPPLRVVVLMGEYVPPELAARALERFPMETAMYSIYGSTEASSTLLCDLRRDWRPGSEVPLGVPIAAHITMAVAGPEGEPCQPGEVGRLFIGGPALFSGYLADPQGTAAALRPLPGHPGRMFDTRDQVRVAPDGAVQYVGRADDTVKVRGFRVDLLDVEHALRSHPGVRQAAVVARRSADGSTSLHGFVVPASVDPRGAFETMRARLPAYMVPSSLHAVDALPFTASGKVDRVRLAAGIAEATVPDAPIGPGASVAERLVADAWATVLGHARFGPADSFFEVGGTSLNVLGLVNRIRAAAGIGRTELDERHVYAAPTVAGLAQHLERLQRKGATGHDAGAPILVTLRRGTAPDLAPLFVIASAGGTLGAYEQLVAALGPSRDIVGIPDPFLWDARDPLEPFEAWVDRYLAAIRSRQATGPYHLCAYSSAGAFGLEVARRLERAGERVALLVLIDPMSLDCRRRSSYGHWALRATWEHPLVRAAIRIGGRLRQPITRRMARHDAAAGGSTPSTEAERRALMERAVRNRSGLMDLAVLLELNTGRPFTLEEADFPRDGATDDLDVLQARVAQLAPELDADRLARIVRQYPLQVHAQHHYRLSPFDGRVLLFEPRSRHAGLIATLLRPYLPRLRAMVIPLGEPSPRVQAIASRFGALGAHYRCMRDATFVNGVAAALTQALDAGPAAPAHPATGQRPRRAS
jgi:amino acid adenylation domain-containing protein